MSVVPSNESWRRISRAVRDNERDRHNRGTGGRRGVSGVQAAVLLRLTREITEWAPGSTEIGTPPPGLYEAEEVRWAGTTLESSEWEAEPGGRQFLEEDYTFLLEINGATGIEVFEDGVTDGTIVLAELRARFDKTVETSGSYNPVLYQWIFNLGGGGSNVIPIKTKAKVIPDGGSFGDPNVDYYCEVYADGSEEAKTDDGIVTLMGINEDSDFPPDTWLLGVKFPDEQDPASLPTVDLVPKFEAQPSSRVDVIPGRISARSGTGPSTEYAVIETDLAGVDLATVVTYTQVKEINDQDDVVIGTKILMLTDGVNHRFWAGSFADSGTVTDKSYSGEHQEAARSSVGFTRGGSTNRFKFTAVVGEAYHDGGDQIWYEYRQDFTIMANGTIRALGDEYRVAIDEPLPC